MLTAKEAILKTREIKKLNHEQSQKEINELLKKEMLQVEARINQFIEMGESETNYVFQDRSASVQLQTVIELERIGYHVEFIDRTTSAIIISWDVESV
jgi:hypothetical protein